MKFKQFTMSQDINNHESIFRSKGIKKPKFRLPNLTINIHSPKTQICGKRFNYVKNRDYLNKSHIKNNMTVDNLLPSSFSNIKDALPVAFLQKKLDLEKSDDDSQDDENLKKWIKVKNPQEYHKGSLAFQELLTGKIEEQKSKSKIVQGKSYLISVSPSQKIYQKKKKLKILSQDYKLKRKDEFRIEDHYENKGATQKIKFKNVWHPVFWQSATLTHFKGESYLIGGINHTVIKQVWSLNENDPKCKWTVEKDDSDIILQRYGHSCCVYKNTLVIFGGQRGQRGSGSK